MTTMGSGIKPSASIFEWNDLKVSRTHIREIIECSFFLSVVGLVISVLISYSKWMYHHFSLEIGGPKKWHIRAFST